ncbi:MAG TPA: hypothetical protein VKA51_14585 [Rubrobacteraceae bacterium]|nr:hypothetical protein [Rubrobacteraceae bacterium]
MPRFLSRYTPHDSYWIGLYLQPKTDAVALVRWDTYWTDGGLPSAGDAVAGWPVLLVRFERVYQTFTAYPGPEERETLSGLPETIAGATSATLWPAEHESLLDTILRAPGGGRVLRLLARRHAAPDHHLARAPLVGRDLARRQHPVPVPRRQRRNHPHPGPAVAASASNASC